jgi:hypothetical protein
VGRLRYKAYRLEQAIDENGEEIFLDAFDNLPNAYNCGVFIQGQLAGALRIHRISRETPISPSVEAFPEVLVPAIEAGKLVTDPNRFVTEYEHARAYPALAYVTVRLAFMATEYFKADFSIATVRKEHEAFYRRLLRCKSCVEPRPYPRLTKNFGLMTMDFNIERANVLARYPFFDAKPAELERIFGPDSAAVLLPSRCRAA